MRILSAVLGLIMMVSLSAQQDLRPIDRVETAKQQMDFIEVELTQQRMEQGSLAVPDLLESFRIFDLNTSAIQELRSNSTDAMRMVLETAEEELELDLVRVNPFSEGAMITIEPSGEMLEPSPELVGVHYRGVVNGKENSIASISLIDGEMAGVISWPSLGANLVIGKMSDTDAHIIYRDSDIQSEYATFCATETEAPIEIEEERQRTQDAVKAAGFRCPDIYLDVSNEVFDNKGGTTGATNYITALFNQVAILYDNDDIGITLAGMTVWSSDEPFGDLSPYRSYRQSNTVPGDLNAYINLSFGGGVAYLNGLCSSFKYSVSGIFSSFSNVPAYSWSVNVLAHELGHNFGSAHTHDCAWNNNNTAIDGCGFNAGFGGCPGSNPSGGGTVMSYCHLTSVGVNLSLGFGPQPTARMDAYIDNSSCVAICGPEPTCNDGEQNGLETGVDCGGPDCAPCPCNGNEYNLELVTDQYPTETTWQIIDGNGAVIASGSGYADEFTTYNIPVCIPDGCFDFVINDSFGDGMCCEFGNGSYTLFDEGGNPVLAGGEFTTSESTSFCTDEGQGGCDQANFVDAPSGLAIQFTGTQLQITWDAYPNSRRCQLRGNRTTQTADGSFFAGNWNGSTEPTQRNFSLSQVQSGTEYRARIRCGCQENGQTVWSPYTPYLIFNTPPGIENPEQDIFKSITAADVIGLYPNPAESEVTLELEVRETGVWNYRLIDIAGRTVLSESRDLVEGYHRILLDVENIDAGTYVLIFEGVEQRIQKQLVIH